MKKYLMTGVAALTLCAGFVGCSKDDDVYDPNAADQLVVAKYEAAFIQAFGQPAADQEWGFGSTKAAARGMVTRAIQPSFNFPSDADESKFLDDVPEGVEKLTPGIGRANHYIDETYEGELNVWGMGTAEGNWMDKSAGILYVKGNCDFSTRSFYFGGDSEIYLVKGATLTLGENNGSTNLQSNTMIYIAEGAKLIANGELMLNNGLHIYNHGTIETPKLSTNNNSVLYNVGTVKVTNRISVENDKSVIVNDGVITATDLNTAGSGKFENNNKVTISGTTFVNSNENTWVNNGDYHTGNFIYYAASNEVINNCKLTVDEDFGINLADNAGNGNFKMDAGSSVVTRNFYGGGNWTGTYAGTYCNAQGGPFYIYMGSGSVFKVLETATMNASKENYGIYGPESGEYAVFQAKDIVMGKEKQGFEVTYGGNLAVSAEAHFVQGHDGRVDHPFIDFKGNAKIYAPGFEDGLPAVNIEESECNPGFAGSRIPSLPDKAIRVFVEDLSATELTDFDFNDIVFDAEYISPTQAKITVWAAGGTLPLQVCSMNGSIYGGGFEVHNAFGVPVKCMVNTHAGPIIKDPGYTWVDFKDVYVTTITLPANIGTLLGLEEGVPTTFVEDDFARGVRDLIRLEVNKGGKWYELGAVKGSPACKIAGPVGKNGSDTALGIKWLLERTPITSGYPDFQKYVGTGYPTNWWENNVNNSALYAKFGNGFTTDCDEVDEFCPGNHQ